MKIPIMAILATLALQASSQPDSIQLMKPTGPYPVGTIIYEWTDEARALQYTSHQGDKRTLNVQIWYPAEIDSNAVNAPYSSLSKDYQKVSANSYLRPSFSKEKDNSNLIIFSPGRGTERYLYTTIIEDLASHGFVVASVDMPGIGYVIYKDGLIIKPSSEFRPPRGMMGGPYEKVDEFFEKPTDIGFTDLQFAFEKIKALNQADINNRFTNRINLREIGIFGHSLGGRIAGKFAAENNNVKAYISMEGIPPRDIRYEGKIKIPIAMLCSSGTLPYAIDNYNSLIENRSNTVFMIELIGFGHNSVTDNPFIYPDSFNYGIAPDVGLAISREITTHYFRSVLNERNSFTSKMKEIEQIKLTEH